jgi:hypothetical protein
MDLFGYTQMLALSWKQPFGTAMLLDKVETRTWDTKYRGKVLICTSKMPYKEAEVKSICGEAQFERLANALKMAPETLPLDGFAIAVGDLVSSKPMQPWDEDKTFVQYRPNLYCHVYKNVRPFNPVPWIGSVGWLKVSQDFIASIQYMENSKSNLTLK